jgi:hypothetical protein
MMKHSALLAVGILAGAAGTLWGIRASRNPDSILNTLRSRLGHEAIDTSEVDWLARHYGPGRQSMNTEEWLVRDFFNDRKGGVFVDVGAADYKQYSNTWFLETQRGWSGIAIDAQASYRAGYDKYRPATKFFAFYVSDRSNEKATLFLSRGAGASSGERDFAASYGGVANSVEMPTITLTNLLDKQGIATFDFLSMDIELAEPKALAGLDIQRFHPSLAVVESHPEVRQKILDYFASNRYVVVGKYLRVDSENLWFMPLGSSVSPFPAEYKPGDWKH